VTMEVPLVMPAAAGKAHFAARMVQEGVAWFGSTAIADIDVVPASSLPDGGVGGGGDGVGGDGDGAGTSGGLGPRGDAAKSASAGCGCSEAVGSVGSEVSSGPSAARGLLFGLVLTAFALGNRRRAPGAGRAR